MRRSALLTSAVLLAAMMVGGAASAPRPFDGAQGRPGVDWPQFRGIAAGGVADGASLPDNVLATPAISEGRLLLRTQDLLMAIGKK